MLINSILPRPTADFLLMSEQAGDGGAGGGGGTPPAPPAPPAADPPPAGVPQSKVDEIVKERVGDTKRATEERIAKDLGVPLDEAKRLIAAAKATEDEQKSEAQRAREAADAEKAEAERTKGESTLARHQANVERHILRNLSLTDAEGKPLDDEAVDKKVGRIARLVDVEVGADADAIKAAVATLKGEEPLMFGTADASTGGTPPPTGDPAGTPPAKPGAEGAFERGKQRAKAAAGPAEYPILAGSQPNNVN
jgi:hypothetical protein